MEKRKVFKISIIDKEISRTEFDRNTFYTSDSELTLVFKLIEKDYTYDHGEILLYNENDKSFVTRKVTKQENDFVYELESDIIPHYGKWKAQLQLVKDGDVYTSKPFDFSIVNDLSNLAPQPTLTDINNWSTLKQSAAELIDEMQGIIIDVERAESERYNQEKIRYNTELERVKQENTRKNSELTRENQENKRQQAESERENNEKQRRIAEFERENKENTRQQAEGQRQSTFETNETERKNTFETAEQGRQSAELTRIENENQRKIDHANRSAELAGKADKKQEDWLTLPLFNGAQHGISPLKVMKDEMGFVHFKGSLTNLVTGSKVFSLPVGYRPDIGVTEAYIRMPVALNTVREMNAVQINYVGDGYINNPSNATVAFFDGVSYLAKRS